MRHLFVIPSLLVLAGCGVSSGQWALTAAGVAAGHKAAEEGIDPVPPPAQRTAEGYADTFRDNVKKTANKVQEWWFTPLPSTEPLPVRASYCYKAQTDVLCYREPMPGWEHRLVAYQGTGAEAPPAPSMELLPKQTGDTSKLAENRVASTKPVFVEPPPEPKEAPKDAGSPAVEDKSHESLPDPATSPQL